jgi:hypothetical protein
MTVSKTPASKRLEPMSKMTFADHGRAMVVHHGERILTEIPGALRRVGLFFMVMAISVPVFLVGLLIVLWRLGN